MNKEAGNTSAHRALGALAAAAGLCLFAAEASAQSSYPYPCNGAAPGRVVVGMSQAGPGMAPFPLCVNRGNASPGESGPTAAPPDPMQIQVNQAMALLKLRLAQTQLDAEERQRLQQDPQQQRLERGAWDFFPKGAPGPDDSCAALFSNRQGVVRIMGPGSGFEGATLTFWSPDMPKPASVETVRMTLLQPKAPPTTVSVLNYYNPAEGVGAAVFVVPSMESALGAFEETQDFEVKRGDESMIKIRWTGGDAARETLRECVRRQSE